MSEGSEEDENSSSVSGISESVQYEHELIKSMYDEKYFIEGATIHLYSLILIPQAEEHFVSVKLNFNASPPYPKSELKCVVENNRNNKNSSQKNGFSDHDIKELQKMVDECVKEHKNDLAASEVIVLVQDYLTEHNRPPESLYDAMQQRHMEEALNKAKDSAASQFVKIYDNEIIKKSPPCLEAGSTKTFTSPSQQSYNITCISEYVDSGSFAGFEIKGAEGKQYLVHEYVMDLSSVKLRDELVNIQKEFHRNHRFIAHSNLLRFIALNSPIVDNEAMSNVVHILTPYALPLINIALPYQNSRQLSKDMITGLFYLHNQSIYHGLLTMCSVYISVSGIHLIGDYGSAKNLLAKSSRSPFKTLDLKYSDARAEKGKFLDILLLGHVVYHACVGRQPTEAYPVPPSDIDPLIRDFIKGCVVRDKNKRSDLDMLLNHEFIGDTALPICATQHAPIMSFSTETGDVSSKEDSTEYSKTEWEKYGRLNAEFEIKETLGTGGFGTVVKVRNKIDGSFYAMKVVKLAKISRKAIQTMRKEVKLLSRLKQDNIVRYNSCFVETYDESSDDTSNSLSENTTSSVEEQHSEYVTPDDFDDTSDSLDIVFEETKDVDVSFYKSKTDIRSKYHEESSEGFSEEDESESDGFDITFDRSKEVSRVTKSENELPTLWSPSNQIIVMFIQMEFCENTTLKTLIRDRSIEPPLHENRDLILLLVRQIVEALVYIHAMNIIHRDLKPANIFLDSKNNVKIGDFGLAMSGKHSHNNPEGRGSSSVVGTSLYIAPEVKTERRYTPLVDIYSLGIITFEMACGPFDTDSERYDVITELRRPEVRVPEGAIKDERLVELIRQMLHHSLRVRPPACKIAENELLPPRLAEKGLQELLRHINAKPDSERRTQFMKILFNEELARGVQQKYNNYDVPDTESQTVKFTKTMNDIIGTMMDVFLKHGAVQCPLPFLLPKCDLTDRQDRPFILLSKSGYYQVLPCNLKLNLARHIIRNQIENLKRYGFTQVFRKRANYEKNPNPREILEGCFDVVTTGSKVIAQAEVLTAVLDVLKSIPFPLRRKVIIYVNHTLITKAILSFCSIESIHHEAILKLLSESTSNYTKLAERLQNELYTLNERHIHRLLTFMKHEGPIDMLPKLHSPFHTIIYKSKSGKLLREGLREILQVLNVLSDRDANTDDILDPSKDIEKLTKKLSESSEYKTNLRDMLRIRPGIVNDPSCYSDFTFQVVIENKDDAKLMDVIAVGGDFQCLLKQWTEHNVRDQFMLSETVTRDLPSAFGVNFLLEEITHALVGPYNTKVLVVSDFGDTNNVEVFTLIRKLWDHDIKTVHVFSDEIEHCSYTAKHTVTFENDTIVVEADPKYIKSLKGENVPNFNKFKNFKSDEVFAHLLHLEMSFEDLELSKKQKTFNSLPCVEKYFDEWEGVKRIKGSKSVPQVSPREKSTSISKSGKGTRKVARTRSPSNSFSLDDP